MNAPSSDLLFVYGTLRRGGRHSAARQLEYNAEWLGFGEFNGRLYDIGPYPGAVPSTDPADRVRGEVFRIRKPEILWPILDRYEEFGPEFPQPNEFVRTLQPIQFKGIRRPMWIYLYNRSTDRLLRLGCDYFAKPHL